MSEANRNRFAYATLIDRELNPFEPEIFLELGVERPVDWNAVDDGGKIICKRLDFVMTVDYVKVGGEPLGIHFVYDRVAKDHGTHEGLYVYVLALRPTRDKEGRDCDRTALVTAHRESSHVRRRSLFADVGEIRVSWRHSPNDVIRMKNGAFEPEAAEEAPPSATDDEVSRMCADFDSWCDAMDPSRGEEDLEASEPGIPLEDDDIEFILDGALVEISTAQDSAPIRMIEKTLAFA